MIEWLDKRIADLRKAHVKAERLFREQPLNLHRTMKMLAIGGKLRGYKEVRAQYKREAE